MKYVIQFRLPLDTTDYTAYVKGFQWPDRRTSPSIDWTPYLHEAITYADGGAARCIQSIIERKFDDAHVLKVTDKELFKAKLANK